MERKFAIITSEEIIRVFQHKAEDFEQAGLAMKQVLNLFKRGKAVDIHTIADGNSFHITENGDHSFRREHLEEYDESAIEFAIRNLVSNGMDIDPIIDALRGIRRGESITLNPGQAANSRF